MENQRLKGADEFSNESEEFEKRLDQLIAAGNVEPTLTRFIAEVTDWLLECAGHGRFIPLGSAERRAFRSMLERWSSRLRDLGIYKELRPLADFDPEAGVVLTGDCPYPGLDPYTEKERTSFFGRESLVSRCVDHIERQGNSVLLIVGASGSGKSSMVLAGIMPRLLDSHDGAWLFAPRRTPGARPMAELATVVAQTISQPGLASDIEKRLSTQPGEALSYLATMCREKPLVLFFDQFEELLTLCRDSDEQSTFAQVLCALSAPSASSGGFCCRILLTLRTDHLARFDSDNALKDLHTRLVGGNNLQHLSAVGFAEIKRAIIGPADAVGLRIIPAELVDQLAAQTAGMSNGLPLLQFALCRLWETRPKNEAGEPLDLITEKMVNGLPEVERALGKVADDIFNELSNRQQQICKRLLLELFVLDESFEEPLRRRRNEDELSKVLVARFQGADDVTMVIEKFVESGLIRRFGEKGTNSQLEVAHEALLRHWDQINELLTGAEVKERLHRIKEIGHDAGSWMGHGRSSDYLKLRGEPLARAIVYRADGWLAEAETTVYVDACEVQENAQKRKEELDNLTIGIHLLTPEQQDIAAEVISHFVTSSGASISRTFDELVRRVNEGKIPQKEVEPHQLEYILQYLGGESNGVLQVLEPSLEHPGKGVRYAISDELSAPVISNWLTLRQENEMLYDLDGNLKKLEVTIWQYIAEILDEEEEIVCDETRYEMRRELNKFHIPRLYLRDKGGVEDIKRMLEKLDLYEKDKGEHATFDGNITPGMIDSLIRFQRQENLVLIDGIVGPETLNRMRERAGG